MIGKIPNAIKRIMKLSKYEYKVGSILPELTAQESIEAADYITAQVKRIEELEAELAIATGLFNEYDYNVFLRAVEQAKEQDNGGLNE